MKTTATDIFQKLQDEGIIDSQGVIQFRFAGIDVQIEKKDVIGNIIEEWVKKWLEAHGIDFIHNESQNPPDFYLDPDDKTKNLLEVKVFDYDASPGFDIADFKMYAKELLQKPFMLQADYLIFGYSMNGGIVTIRRIWLQKVWEITRRGRKTPLFLQVKNGTIHKIRPAKWYSDKRIEYNVFTSTEHFISAINETMHSARDQMGDIDTRTWLSDFKTAYKQQYSQTLTIPRWDDIADSYDVKLEKKKAKATKDRDDASKKVDKAQEVVASLEGEVQKAQTEKQRTAALERLQRAQASLQVAEQLLEQKQQFLNSL